MAFLWKIFGRSLLVSHLFSMVIGIALINYVSFLLLIKKLYPLFFCLFFLIQP
jgi:hypothetical protein